jgi:hypothetical protein
MNFFDITKKYYKLACMDGVILTWAIVPSQYCFKTWWKVVQKELSDIKYNNIISTILCYNLLLK